jgi:hypothetical protein
VAQGQKFTRRRAVQRLDRLHAEQQARPAAINSTVVALADEARVKVQPTSSPEYG